MPRDLRSWIAGAVLLRASVALAQPGEPPPPPPAPDANWAPPLPAEAPPPSPPSETAPQPETPFEASPPSESAGTPLEAATEHAKDEGPETEMEIYGFTMLDGGFDFGKVGDPDWEDVLRPTKLPKFADQFGRGGRTFAGVRQTRFGVKTKIPTRWGDMKTVFEWELFGVGVDAGQTTFRLRHAYGKWHHMRAGQTWSPFMDPDVFPNSLEYWGPPAMPFFRNVQLAYSFIDEENSDVTLALERPGASADSADLGERIDITGVVPRFPAPDISLDGKWGTGWGYVRAAGIMRYMRWDDLMNPPVVQGHVWGWGFNASSNIKLGPTVLKLQATYGRAIENYMNDADADVGLKNTSTTDIEGKALPVFGALGFLDITWCDLLTSSLGYSYLRIWNSDGQLPDAFHISHYALINLLVHPTERLMMGAEFQFGRRENNDDGFHANDFKLQLSVKYSFSKTFGGKK